MSDIVKQCEKHGKTKHFKRPDTKNTYRCWKCVSDAVSRRRNKLKQLAIEYKGGSCELCGYDKCVGALTFHHLDPNEKDFGISKSGHTRSWARLKVELDKCAMLCANCHAEVHSGLAVIHRVAPGVRLELTTAGLTVRCDYPCRLPGMAHPLGLEPRTRRLTACCSKNQLS